MDGKGRLLVANPGLGVAWVLNHKAEPELVLRSCAGASLTNLAFGGPGRSTLYCTESTSGSVLRAELDAPGAELYRPLQLRGP
jgi:gluconolactonase